MNENQLYDLTQLEKIAQNNKEFISDMLNTFCNDSPEMIEKMVESIDQKKYASLYREAHRYIPSISFLGATHIKSKLEKIEDFAKNNRNIEYLPELVRDVKKEVEELIRQFKNDFNL